MSTLFKERVNKSYSEDFAWELLSVLEAPQSLEGVLFGDTEHKAYIIAGSILLATILKFNAVVLMTAP